MTHALTALAAFTLAPLAHASFISYIPNSSGIRTWDFTGSKNEGWSFNRTVALSGAGVVLGQTPPPEVDNGAWIGMMSVAVPVGFTYADSGVEMTFTMPSGSSAPTDGFEFLSVWHDDARNGFTMLSYSLDGSGWTQQEEGGPNQAQDGGWTNGSAFADDTIHTMALVRHASGVLDTYIDDVMVNSRLTDDPTTAPEFISIGANVNGNMYMPFGSVVSQVRAFGLTAIPEPGSLLALGLLVGSGICLRSRRNG